MKTAVFNTRAKAENFCAVIHTALMLDAQYAALGLSHWYDLDNDQTLRDGRYHVSITANVFLDRNPNAVATAIAVFPPDEILT